MNKNRQIRKTIFIYTSKKKVTETSTVNSAQYIGTYISLCMGNQYTI